MALQDDILKLNLKEYPDMLESDILDFDELFSKIIYGDCKKYPNNKELEYGVGVILKRTEHLIKRHLELEGEINRSK